MTDKEMRKLGRRELLELLEAQGKSYEAAKKRLEALEQENKTLRESLTNLGKTMNEQRGREEAASAVLAEKDAALKSMEQELAEVRAGQTDKGRLEEQVDLLFESFRQVKPILQEKDRQLQAAERTIAERERTIRSLQERLRGRG